MYNSCEGETFLAMPQGLDPEDFSGLYMDISVQV
jgi:hypothetical protein